MISCINKFIRCLKDFHGSGLSLSPDHYSKVLAYIKNSIIITITVCSIVNLPICNVSINYVLISWSLSLFLLVYMDAFGYISTQCPLVDKWRSTSVSNVIALSFCMLIIAPSRFKDCLLNNNGILSLTISHDILPEWFAIWTGITTFWNEKTFLQSRIWMFWMDKFQFHLINRYLISYNN